MAAGGESAAAVETHGPLAVAGGELWAAAKVRGRPAVAMGDGGLSLPWKAAWDGESLQRAATCALVPSAMVSSAPPVGVSAWTAQASGPLLGAVAVCGRRPAVL